MKKIALGVQYDGNFYHGWQRQKDVPSVQEEVEKALSIIADHKIEVICAGRTDTGVHSIGQVIHFYTTASRQQKSWIVGTNTYLSHSISIFWVKEVSQTFHARYSAIARSYRYIIYNHHVRSAIFQNKVHHVYKKLDIYQMNHGAQFLLGEHDFTSFRASNCQSHSTWRNIVKLDIKKLDHWVIINITANSFLYRMVRNIVGSLIEVGTYKKNYMWIKELLIKKNRHYTGFTASAKGLYLVHAEYPAHFDIPNITTNTMMML